MVGLAGQKNISPATPSVAKRPKQTSSVNLVNSAINAKVSSTPEVVKSSMTQAELLNSEKFTKLDPISKKLGIQFCCLIQVIKLVTGAKKQDEHLLSDIRDFRGLLKKAPPPKKNLVVVSIRITVNCYA